MRIIREHEQWWIMREVWVMGIPRQHVVGNIEGPYEEALAKFFRLLNNYRIIKEKDNEKPNGRSSRIRACASG